MKIINRWTYRVGSATFWAGRTRGGVSPPDAMVAWTAKPPTRWYQRSTESESEFLERVREDIRRGHFPVLPEL